jgi:hypothetical protein
VDIYDIAAHSLKPQISAAMLRKKITKLSSGGVFAPSSAALVLREESSIVSSSCRLLSDDVD